MQETRERRRNFWTYIHLPSSSLIRCQLQTMVIQIPSRHVLIQGLIIFLLLQVLEQMISFLDCELLLDLRIWIRLNKVCESPSQMNKMDRLLLMARRKTMMNAMCILTLFRFLVLIPILSSTNSSRSRWVSGASKTSYS